MKKHGLRLGRLVPLAVILLCCSLFVSLVRYQVAISSKKQELANVQDQLNQQLAQNEELTRSLADGEDAIIERIAREQGYAKPNERVFVDISGK